MTTQPTQTRTTDATSEAGVPRADPVRSTDRPEHGAVLFVPLDKLRVPPRNARKTPHLAEAIEALAGSNKAKGVIQPLVVEIETDADSASTGRYLVTSFAVHLRAPTAGLLLSYGSHGLGAKRVQ